MEKIKKQVRQQRTKSLLPQVVFYVLKMINCLPQSRSSTNELEAEDRLLP